MYAKIENNVVTKYPVDAGEIKSEFPQISFPVDFIPPEPYVKVWVTGKPDLSENQTCVESTPVLQGGRWIQAWNVITLSAQEYQEKLQAARDLKLAELAQKRWEASLQGITYNGSQYATDFESRMLYDKYAAANQSVNWKLSNGLFIILQGYDFQQISLLAESQIQSLFQLENTMTDKVNSFSTIAQINSIDANCFS